jgi:hypothetical protein
VWIVPIVLVVLGVLGFVLFRGGGAASLIPGGPDNTIPDFAFKQGKTSAVAVKDEKKNSVPSSAESAAADVKTAMTRLYTEAFLDPANWRDGSYDEVWPVFFDNAVGPAQQDASTLTVGTGGGDTFTKIAEPKGRLNVKVLLNDKDEVATAVAIVKFSAVGTRKDGKLTVFHSTGQYFLRPGDGGWQVYSFDVKRADQVKQPKPSAGPSGSSS